MRESQPTIRSVEELAQRLGAGDKDLSGALLGSADLRDFDLTECNLDDASLSESNLSGVTLIEASLVGAHLSRANLRNAKLWAADLQRARLRGADASGAALVSANLRHADARESVLLGANLSGANLFCAQLNGARLIGADLGRASLPGANLDGALAMEADFSAARLWHASLCDADLRNAKLIDASMIGARIDGADLSGADIHGADLSDAQMFGARIDGSPDSVGAANRCRIDAETYRRSGWTPHTLAAWLDAGAVIVDREALPADAIALITARGEGLTLYLRAPIERLDRLLIDLVIFSTLGRDADCAAVEVVPLQSRGFVRLDALDPAALTAVADALTARLWRREQGDQLNGAWRAFELDLDRLAARVDRIELRGARDLSHTDHGIPVVPEDPELNTFVSERTGASCEVEVRPLTTLRRWTPEP